MRNSSFFHNAKASVALWLNNFLGINKKIQEATKDAIRTDQFEGLAREVSSLKEKLTPAKVASMHGRYEVPEKGLKILVSASNGVNAKDERIFHINRPAWTDGRSSFFRHAPLGRSAEISLHSVRADGLYTSCTTTMTQDMGRFLRPLFDSNLIACIDTENAFTFTLTKPGSETWEEILPKLIQVIASTFEHVKVPVAEESSSQE